MGKIQVETCHIEGLKVITPQVFGDERGYFMETWQQKDFAAAGMPENFVQDNQSSSRRGVLRGLHYQINFPQDKLVRVVRGEVFDVAVDLREGSETFGQWFGVLLSAENKKQFFIPKNFAHGFLVLSDPRDRHRVAVPGGRGTDPFRERPEVAGAEGLCAQIKKTESPARRPYRGSGSRL